MYEFLGKIAVLIALKLAMIKKRIVLFVFILSGCATFTGYNSMVESYHGISEAELIRTWGIPSKINESQEGRFLTYSKSDTAMFGLMETKVVCETTFEMQDRKVVSSTFEGGQCRGWGKNKYDLSNRQFSPPD